jgi:hypothetical protein
MSFEKGRIKELADLCPDLSGHLMKIHDNCKDLMAPFQKGHYYHEDFGSGYSLKTILPVLFSDDKSLDYNALKNIHNGKKAMDAGAAPYTQLDIYQMGYGYTLGPTVFTDLLAKGDFKA